MNEVITVGISDMKIAQYKGTIITYALGSCIGLCLYDPILHLAGMLHILLPKAPGPGLNPYKYADTGFREMLRTMETFGCQRRRLIAKMAGGAKMFEIPNESNFGNIGAGNIQAMKKMLDMSYIPLAGQAVGGDIARTLSIDVATGAVSVKTLGRDEIIL